MTEHHLQRPPATTPKLYAQDGLGYAATVHAHYFIGSMDWLVTEYDPEEDIAFGWANLGDPQNAELGYTNLAELEGITVPFPFHITGLRGTHVLQLGARVEYDEHWTPVPLRQAVDAVLGRSSS